MRRAPFDAALQTLWLAHQPIVEAKTGALFGYEVLMRSENATIAGPADLLSSAIETGQLRRLGRHVRDLAARSPVLESDGPLLFVNLHASDLADHHLLAPDQPLTRVAKRVVLEITERTSLGDVQDVESIACSLRELGFRIAVDDLGAGYSGLNTLALLEPEFVKIDMSLVRAIDTKPAKQRIVAGLVSLAHDLGTKVVSEGVETEAEQRTLVELGTDLLQGYLIGAPGHLHPAR